MHVANEVLKEQRDRKRRQRVAALEQVISLSAGQNLEAELKRISEERDAF